MSVELSQTTIMSRKLNGQVKEDRCLLIWPFYKEFLQIQPSMAVVCDVKVATK